MIIRLLDEHDSIAELTALLHRAYGALAEMGFRFFASHQSEEDTRKRASNGPCFVAEENGTLIGTIVVFQGHSKSDCEWYRNDGVWIFGQFGVEPSLQRRGIGNALLDRAEEEARRQGARHLACDTAEGAMHLINYYMARGFLPVGHVRWSEVNYRSVVLSKKLD